MNLRSDHQQQFRRVAWVTGATSFIGRQVALSLAQHGFAVAGFARHPIEVTKDTGYSFIESGPFSASLLQRGYERAGAPAVVFHAIGASSVSQASADPIADVERTLRLTECAVEAVGRLAPQARFIYPSSAAVYGQKGLGPISEDSPVQPASLYGENKLHAEKICEDISRRNGLKIVIARFFSVYGPPQRKLLLWDLGTRLISGEREILLGGTGEETRDFVNVKDAAAIIGALAVAPQPPQLLNVGSGLATSIRTLAKKLSVALNVQADIAFDGQSRPGDPPHQQADISRLSALGIPLQTSLEQGLLEYANWLRVAVGEKRR